MVRYIDVHALYIDKRYILGFLCISYVYPMFSSVFLRLKTDMDDHGILHYMTCSSAVWVPAAAASCALLAHLNAAHLLPA